MFEKRKNPYYRVLMKEQASRRKDRHKRRIHWLRIFIIIAILPFLFYEMIPLSCGCTMILLLSPIFIATAFAQTSARHTQSADYELITITPLSEEYIVWGQFYSTLDYKIHWRQMPYGLVPVAFALILIGISIAFALEDASEWQVVPAVLCIIFSFAGIYWSLNFTGVAVGLATRRPGIASWIMTGTGLVTLAIWGVVVIILLEPFNRPHWLIYIFFVILPYLPIGPALFLAHHFARNPVISPPSS